MFPIQEFFGLMARSFIQALFSPLLWIVMGLIAWRYYRLAQARNILIGENRRRDFFGAFSAVVLGMAGGWLGSLIMGFAGLTINELNIPALWIVALILMMIHPRFVCFSYGGSLLILLSLVLGWPKINGPALLALIGGLHLIESLLIFISGEKGAQPLWMQHPKTKEWVIGFRMEHFWPIPLLLFAAGWIPTGEIVEGTMSAFAGWPLFPLMESLPEGTKWAFLLVPVVAAVGYADFSVTCSPQEKSKQTGIGLFIYSVILLVLSWLSVSSVMLLVLGALFSSGGHEGLIRIQNRREWNGQPILRANFDHLSVLIVEEGSIAENLGIVSGDQLLELSGYPLNHPDELKEALFWSPSNFTITWSHRGEMRSKSGVFKVPGAQRKLGVLPLMRGLPISFITGEPVSLGRKLWKAIRDENRGRKKK